MSKSEYDFRPEDMTMLSYSEWKKHPVSVNQDGDYKMHGKTVTSKQFENMDWKPFDGYDP